MPRQVASIVRGSVLREQRLELGKDLLDRKRCFGTVIAGS